MKLHALHNKKAFHAPVTRQNHFAGLGLAERLRACEDAIRAEIVQFKNETKILLEIAQQGFEDGLIYEVENETGVCLDLASFDLDAEALGKHYREKLKGMLS